MGIDTDLTVILREIVQFLECLREVKLPLSLENIRDNLLVRSRNSLSTVTALRRSASPEAYLNMNAGPRGLQSSKVDSDVQEYVGAEEPRDKEKEEEEDRRQQDYYESFQDVERSVSSSNEEHPEDSVVEIYANLSGAQTKSKCYKCGPLSQKEGKKLFVFEQYRTCWVGLVGSHLLIYTSERDSRPYMIQPIRGYMGRPAPNVITRDQRRSESAFEIFCPGHKTLQFVARTPKDMEQWVAKICEIGSRSDRPIGFESELRSKEIMMEPSVFEQKPSALVTSEELSKWKEEHSVEENPIDVTDRAMQSVSPKKHSPREEEQKEATGKDEECNSTENSSNFAGRLKPPPLPARIPRRLPSLPSEEITPSYEPMEDEEDDIYHRIEDYRDNTRYQNVALSKGTRSCANEKALHSKDIIEETYDDVGTSKIQEKLEVEEKEKKVKMKMKMKMKLKKKLKKKDREEEQEEKREEEEEEKGGGEEGGGEEEETYDDVGCMSEKGKKGNPLNSKVDHNVEEPVSYDDVASFLTSVKSGKNQKNKTNESSKSPQKISFLEKVRSRKEISWKSEKKSRNKISAASLPTYDDVTEVMAVEEVMSQDTELPEYNCPPPPRPIYAKPPEIIEEFYDDVSVYRAKRTEEKIDDQSCWYHPQLASVSSDNETKHDVHETFAVERNLLEQGEEETEHYRSPKGDPCPFGPTQHVSQEEELYDDIAILAEFTARQRESIGKKERETEESRSTNSPDKKPWNRFAAHRKSKSSDSSYDTNRRSCNETENIDVFEHHGLSRMNTFQKLISKMENSLNKTTPKTPSPLSTVSRIN